MRTSMAILLAGVLFLGAPPADSSDRNWEIVHRLVQEANAVDRQWLDRAAGKGMRDSARSESRRAWERVKAHLESLSPEELVETAAAAAESAARRAGLTEAWEREAAAASDVEFVLSVYDSKDPAPRDVDALVRRIEDGGESACFRIALLAWFSRRITQGRLPPGCAGQAEERVRQAGHDLLCDLRNPEPVRLAAYDAYAEIVIQDILSTCRRNEALRPYLRDPERRLRLFRDLDSGGIAVPDAVRTRLMDGSKGVAWLLENFRRELAGSPSARIGSMIRRRLRQLGGIPIGAEERQEVERLRSGSRQERR